MHGRFLVGAMVAAALVLAPSARAEIVEDGVANGRFAEFVGFGESGFLSGGIAIEPGGTVASADVHAWDFASGAMVVGSGAVPLRHAQISGDWARLSFDLAEVPGFLLTVCGSFDGGYDCVLQASGRVEVTLRRAGVAVHENGTTAIDLPDGAVRRVTLTGTTAPATVEGAILGQPLPASTQGKLGRYHQRVVVVDRPR